MKQRKEIALEKIKIPKKYELEDRKLYALENSYDSFDYQLKHSSEPIALSGTYPPYEIINGRHRVYLAKQKGMKSVPAIFI